MPAPRPTSRRQPARGLAFTLVAALAVAGCGGGGGSRGGTLQEILDFLPGSVRQLPAVKADQITLWDAAGAYGYRNVARIIDRLAGAVEHARAGIDS